MIALLLAAQLSAALPSGPPPEAAAPSGPAFARNFPGARTGLIRTLPASGNCPGAGRMEASLAQPMALYRSGDRPAKMYLRWADYPDPRMCQAGAAP
jgi:hypothetical protein